MMVAGCFLPPEADPFAHIALPTPACRKLLTYAPPPLIGLTASTRHCGSHSSPSPLGPSPAPLTDLIALTLRCGDRVALTASC